MTLAIATVFAPPPLKVVGGLLIYNPAIIVSVVRGTPPLPTATGSKLTVNGHVFAKVELKVVYPTVARFGSMTLTATAPVFIYIFNFNSAFLTSPILAIASTIYFKLMIAKSYQTIKFPLVV